MEVKHYIYGKCLYSFLLEKYKDRKKAKAEYARCLWIMREKGMTPEEAFNYHRVPKNPKWKWIKKVNQRRRVYKINKNLLEMPDEILIEIGRDKMAKYFYKDQRLHKYCLKRGLNYKAIITIKKRFGGDLNNIVDDYKKGKYLSWYEKNKKPIKPTVWYG